MKWLVELEGGEAFPHNAAAACRLAAAGKLVPETGEVFQRLAAALAAARTAPGPEPTAAEVTADGHGGHGR